MSRDRRWAAWAPLVSKRGRQEWEEIRHFNDEQLFSSITVNERKLLLLNDCHVKQQFVLGESHTEQEWYQMIRQSIACFSKHIANRQTKPPSPFFICPVYDIVFHSPLFSMTPSMAQPTCSYGTPIQPHLNILWFQTNTDMLPQVGVGCCKNPRPPCCLLEGYSQTQGRAECSQHVIPDK